MKYTNYHKHTQYSNITTVDTPLTAQKYIERIKDL